MFAPYLALWDLTPDGEPIVTHSSRLLPVIYAGTPAMLKVAVAAEEEWGATLMVWWDGAGAARVLAHESDALLLERIEDGASLIEMVRRGDDAAASRIICGVAAQLHAPCSRPRPALVPLLRWFEELEPAARLHGGILRTSAATARELLAAPQDVTVLHGDLHHGNVLDAGARGWLAIDPKGLVGERGFDFANIFCNPDIETAVLPNRLTSQVDVVSKAANLSPVRLLKWILAYAGLSAAWNLNGGTCPSLTLAIAQLAAAGLGS